MTFQFFIVLVQISIQMIIFYVFVRADLKTKHLYEKVSYLLPDNHSVLKVFRSHPFYEVYRFLSVNVLVNGLHSSRAESFLAMTIISQVLYDGGLPMDEEFNGFFQVQDKKRFISQNEILVDDDTFRGVGYDSHVNNLFTLFLPPGFESKKDFIKLVCQDIDPSVGWYANEIIGQMDQFIAGNEAEKEFACTVFNHLLAKYPHLHDRVCQQFIGKAWFQGKLNVTKALVSKSKRKKATSGKSEKRKRRGESGL